MSLNEQEIELLLELLREENEIPISSSKHIVISQIIKKLENYE